jgi:hypothetical protein
MDRRTRHTVILLSVLAAIAATLPAAGASGHPSKPAHPTTIVGHQASTQRASLGLVAGGPTYLVYWQTPVRTSDTAPLGGGHTPPGRLLVRHATDRHSRTTALSHAGGDIGRFSLSAKTLTARVAISRTVRWWNVRSGRRGAITLPKHTTYLSAAPSGATYMTRKGGVHIAKITGGTKRLGRPFNHEPEAYYRNSEVEGADFAAADGKGLALGDDHGHARYIRFAKPGKVVKLETDGTADQLCTSVNHHYAACIGAVDHGDGPGASSATITPLDGSAGTTVSRKHYPDAAPNGDGGTGLHGSTMLWTHLDYVNSGEDPQARPVSVEAGRSTPTVGTKDVATVGGPLSAFGKAIYSNSDDASNVFLEASSADHLTALQTAPPSLATAGSFAIAGGRLADVDDARDPSSSAKVAVHTRTISASGGRITTGSPSTVASGSTKSFYPDEVAISSTAVAYLAANAAQHQSPSVHLVTSHGNEDLGQTVDRGVLALSGQRLLYENLAPNHDWQLTVRNLGDDTDVHIASRADPNFPAAAIDGDFVAYMTSRGVVYRTDMTTGHRVQLASAPKKQTRGLRNLRVYESGDWVGWSFDRGRYGQIHVDVIRNARTMAKPVMLSRRLIGLSTRGALVADNAGILPDYGTGQTLGAASAVRLRTFGGKLRLIASRRAYIAVPKLDGRTLVWIDAKGRLRSAVLPTG